MRSSNIRKKLEQAGNIIEDPVGFTQVMLRQGIWAKQQEILQSVVTHPRTAVKAAHSSGKTFVAAALVLWWITCNKEAIAVTTAPTWMQVKRLLWGEIRRLAYHAKIDYPKPAAASLSIGPNRYAIGLSTNEGVRLQGFHAEKVLI